MIMYFYLLLLFLARGSFLVIAGGAREVAPALHVNQRAFADSLTSKLYENENDCTSALGVSMAFSLIYPAMTGNSYSQVQNAFGYPADNKSQLVWNNATTKLNGEYQGLCPFEGCRRKEPIVSIANSVWIDSQGTLDPTYNDVVKDLLFWIDFTDVSAADQINAWVNETTRGLIDQIVQQQDLQNLILLALNSIYLKANWAKAFAVGQTNEDVFYKDAARTVVSNNNAHFMHTVEFFPYSETALPDYQIAKLPFTSNSLSFIIVLPKSGVETSSLVNSANLVDALPSLKTERIALALPKFEIKSTYSETLKSSLQSLGIRAPFAGGLCVYENDCRSLIEFVIQKTFISVDEDGVEAAAVTAIGVARSSARPTVTPTLFMADHPFQFFIYDELTQLVLFEGRVGSPTPQGGSVAALTARHSDSDFWTSNFNVDPTAPEVVAASQCEYESSSNERPGLMFTVLTGFVGFLWAVGLY